MTYISLCRDYGHLYWPELDKCDSGTILYISRDKPSLTYEFNFDYDENWWKDGKKRLEDWKQAFIEDRLPQKPEGFMWSKGACQYCDYKKHACKPDFQQEVDKISESNGINWASSHYPSYNFEEQKNNVIERWKDAQSD